MIGEIVQQKDLQQLAKLNENNFSANGYVAPTMFRPAGGQLKNFPAYTKMSNALSMFKFNNSLTGGKFVKPNVNIAVNVSSAATVGVNVDFFSYLPVIGVVPIPYWYVKNTLFPSNTNQCIVRFYDNDAKGPFYGILDKRQLGITATVIKSGDAKKIAVMDAIHRDLQLLKINFNNLAEIVSYLKAKKNKSAAELKMLASTTIVLQNFEKELRSLKYADVSFSSKGSISGIGIIPVIIWVVVIVSAAIIAALTFEKLIEEQAKTARLVQEYSFQTKSNEQVIQIKKDVAAGVITKSDGAELIKMVTDKAEASQAATTAATQPAPGILDHAENLLLYGILGFAAVKILPSLLNKK